MSTVPHAWNINIDFIGRMYGILALSAVLCIASLVAVFTMGLNFGTDFAGGYEIQVHFPQAETETQIRDILAPMDLQDARVQRFGDEADNEYLIMVRSATSTVGDDTKQAVKADMEKMAGGP